VVYERGTDKFESVQMRRDEIGDLFLGQVRTVSSLQDMYHGADQSWRPRGVA
jgi:hypothetical protein